MRIKSSNLLSDFLLDDQSRRRLSASVLWSVSWQQLLSDPGHNFTQVSLRTVGRYDILKKYCVFIKEMKNEI